MRQLNAMRFSRTPYNLSRMLTAFFTRMTLGDKHPRQRVADSKMRCVFLLPRTLTAPSPIRFICASMGNNGNGFGIDGYESIDGGGVDLRAGDSQD